MPGAPAAQAADMTSLPVATPRSAAPLAAAWFLTAAVVGPLGLLLFALSESSGDRVLGAVHAGAGLLAAGTAGALLAGSGAARRWSRPLSAGLVVLGAAAAVVVLGSDPVFFEDVLLLGAPPVVGGVVTALLARTGQPRDRPPRRRRRGRPSPAP